MSKILKHGINKLKWNKKENQSKLANILRNLSIIGVNPVSGGYFLNCLIKPIEQTV